MYLKNCLLGSSQIYKNNLMIINKLFICICIISFSWDTFIFGIKHTDKFLNIRLPGWRCFWFLFFLNIWYEVGQKYIVILNILSVNYLFTKLMVYLICIYANVFISLKQTHFNYNNKPPTFKKFILYQPCYPFYFHGKLTFSR